MARKEAMTKDECPDRAKHAKEPEGYLAWHEWGDEEGADASAGALPDVQAFRDLGAEEAEEGVSGVDLEMWKSLLSRFEMKGTLGAKARIVEFSERLTYLVLTATSSKSNDPMIFLHPEGTLVTTMHFTLPVVLDEQAARKFLQRCCRVLAVHEADECIWIGGERPFDPHLRGEVEAMWPAIEFVDEEYGK